MTTISPNPVILFVHGAWHHPSCWEVIQKPLEQAGFPTRTATLASPGSPSPGAGLKEDVAAVRKDLDELVTGQGKDVVMVMHSYGGMAGGGAVKGLEKKQREQSGEKGGVTACLFIASFLVPKGKGLLGMFPDAPPYLVDHPDDHNFWTVVDFHETFYNDVSKEASHPYVSTMRPQPKATFEDVVESVPWESGLVPCVYLMCEKDQGVFPFVQEIMIEARKEDSPKPFVVEKVNASHSAWLSQPNVVTELVVKVAKGSIF